MKDPGTETPIRLPTWRGRLPVTIGLLSALLFAIILATAVGSVRIPFATVFHILASGLPFTDFPRTWPDTLGTIVLDVRLPRVIMAGVVGAALSTAGATYQGVFRNPLADPYLIGVAQGATLGAVAGFLVPFNWLNIGPGVIPLFAFTGAVISSISVYSLGRVGRTLPVTTVALAGVALGTLWGAVASYLIILSGERMHGIIFWLMGSFSLAEWAEVRFILPYIAAGILVILVFSRTLNIMQLDEEQAQQLGVNIERTKLILLAAATLITAASVSFIGAIGFVGIIIPHLVRLLWGTDYRFLLPFSVLMGAVFLILADLVARTALAPAEIPISVITALCGAPFFLYILRAKRKTLF